MLLWLSLACLCVCVCDPVKCSAVVKELPTMATKIEVLDKHTHMIGKLRQCEGLHHSSPRLQSGMSFLTVLLCLWFYKEVKCKNHPFWGVPKKGHIHRPRAYQLIGLQASHSYTPHFRAKLASTAQSFPCERSRRRKRQLPAAAMEICGRGAVA